MELPRFTLANINPKYLPDDIGDAFQRFAHEVLLPFHPGLTLFPSRGKDGCIDMIQDSEAARIVVQAKFCAEDSIERARAAWKADGKVLGRNLLSGSGPPPGQSQYAPWFRSDLPISGFMFCTSAVLPNVARRDALKKEIAGFFVELAARNPSLEHLAALTEEAIEILDWRRLVELLKSQPLAVYRWFPSTRPIGLVPFERSHESGSLREYLISSKLPYYSARDYMDELGSDDHSDLPSVEKILETLEGDSATGVIISGAGGVGKTRLSLEAASLAQEHGWIVLRSVSRLSEEAIIELAEWLAPQMRVLVLFDYMELQHNSAELIEAINRLNDTYELHLRYMGTCRRSYYRALRDVPRHKGVFLPSKDAADRQQLEGFSSRVVRHVLQHSGLPANDDLLRVCRDTPVLAVFLSYLKESGRTEDLNALLGEGAFVTWVRKRARTSFPREEIDRELSILMGLLPLKIDDEVRAKISWAEQLLNTLAADGWIEKVRATDSDAEQWICLHDVFADQLLLNYMEDHRWAPEQFLGDLLGTASSCGCTSSVLTALQRVSDQPCFEQVNWLPLLTRSIVEDVEKWLPAALPLLDTSLLSPAERIALLALCPSIWEPVIRDTAFQNKLGWLVRWAARQEPGVLSDEDVPLSSGYVLLLHMQCTRALCSPRG